MQGTLGDLLRRGSGRGTAGSGPRRETGSEGEMVCFESRGLCDRPLLLVSFLNQKIKFLFYLQLCGLVIKLGYF